MIIKFLERFGAKVVRVGDSRDVFTLPKINLRAIIHPSLQKTPITLGTHSKTDEKQWVPKVLVSFCGEGWITARRLIFGGVKTSLLSLPNTSLAPNRPNNLTIKV